MIDLRTVPEETNNLMGGTSSLKEGVNTVRSWIKPVGAGRFGLSFSWGSKEIFIGVSIAKILTETVVKRKDKRVLVRMGESKVFDL